MGDRVFEGVVAVINCAYRHRYIVHPLMHFRRLP
jgi:hypothetical protein